MDKWLFTKNCFINNRIYPPNDRFTPFSLWAGTEFTPEECCWANV